MEGMWCSVFLLHLSIHPSIHLFVHPSILSSILSSIFSSIIHPSICTSIHPFIHPPFHSSIIDLFSHPSIHPFIHQLSFVFSMYQGEIEVYLINYQNLFQRKRTSKTHDMLVSYFISSPHCSLNLSFFPLFFLSYFIVVV